MTKNNPIRFITFAFLFVSLVAEAQKVKYKDLFGLLSTRQYEPAEPFLKKYLLENDDNPNAFLFMGIIFQEKSAKIDILRETARATAAMDSAILFYDKALKTIDERELRKNKEYYQAYNRRDLRTGEFGVKLSDIQLDLQTRIDALKERIGRVKMAKYYFILSDSLYRRCQSLFAALQKEYPSERQLYLRSDDRTLKNLTTLALRFDSVLRSFDTYKSTMSSLGRTGYNQTLTPVEINDFRADGVAAADFYKDDLRVWDYRKFSEKAKGIIEKEIIPMRSHLITYDIEINKLRERLNNDSVSVRSDLTRLIDVLLYEQLTKYDPDPLPMEVFSMKIADLEYRSALIEHRPLRDSADIHLQLGLLEREFEYLNKLDSVATKLASEDIDQEAVDYGYFITNTFSNTIVLHSYIRALKDYAAREKRKKNEELARYQASLNWIVDVTDSIPLVPELARGRFKPLFVAEESYTVGLAFEDSLSADGYLYAITPSRVPSMKVRFPVDKTSFRQSLLPATKALAYSDAAGQIFYVLIFAETGATYPATLAKIYRSDGLAWSNNITLAFRPHTITFRPETSELLVRDDTQQVVIDKNGKMLK